MVIDTSKNLLILLPCMVYANFSNLVHEQGIYKQKAIGWQFPFKFLVCPSAETMADPKKVCRGAKIVCMFYISMQSLVGNSGCATTGDENQRMQLCTHVSFISVSW